MSIPPQPHAGADRPPLALRILVVDDSPDAADSLGLLLSVLGHEVRTAHDGPTALNIARTFIAQVTFLDLALPKMDGFQVARRLRELAGWQGCSLIAMTAHGQEEYRRRCRQEGFDFFLLKPFDPAELQHILSRQGTLG